MRITKYVHSCLLVETANRVGIIDPGQFSWESGLFQIEKLERLDDIIITHEHFDHLSIPFIQALLTAFPSVKITTTPSAAAKLATANLPQAQTQSSEGIELFATNHEPLAPLGQPPQHTGVHYVDQLSHPGDSHHFTETKKILALPVTAPWGTVIRAAALGAELKPHYIIPIHDWHWSEIARANTYDQLEAFFKPQGITFCKPIDGQPLEGFDDKA